MPFVLVLAVFAVAFTATPALAAAPEAPELTVKPIFASIAVFNGTLSPKGLVPAEGTYRFLYKASSSECEGGLETTPGVALGGAPEALPPEQVKGLTPATEYTVCLSITNAASETATSTPVTFKTTAAGKPEAPQAGEAGEIKATSATLNGVVNPLKEGEPGKYRFLYGQSESECTAGSQTAEESAPGSSPQPVSAAISGLEAGKPYTFCVQVINALGEATLSAPRTFRAAISPQTPTGLEAKPIAATTATLNGILNAAKAGDPGSYEFLYEQSASECNGEGYKTAPEPAGAASGASPEPVQAQVKGLLPNMPYSFCLLARNEAGEEALSAPVTFTTLAEAPTIVGEFVSTVEASAATLHAEIIPEGTATTAHFEYLKQAQYEADGNTFGAGTETTTESGVIGADDSVHSPPPARITPLQQATVYRYRVVATNECETGKQCVTDGPGKTFTTSAAPGTEPPQKCENEQRRVEQPFAKALPDCRAYELVSSGTEGQDASEPPEGNETNRKPRAAVSGEAIAYDSDGSFAQPGGAQLEDTILSQRKQDRWGTRSIMAPYTAYQRGGNFGYDGDFFTPELTEGVTSTFAALGGEGAPEGLGELYRADFAAGSYTWLSHLPATEEPYARPRDFGLNAGVYPDGASENLTHVVFFTISNLPGHPEGILREWADGRVSTVDVSNKGEVWEAGVGASKVSAPRPGGVWRAVSADGSRVVFDRSGGGTGPLYLRQNGERKQSKMNGEECLEPSEACTILISPGEATYRGANVDDSRIFYTENGDLYEYVLEPGQVVGHTTALTTGGEVQGIAQISEDGSYVYFVADAVLTKELNAQGREAQQGACLPGGTRLPSAPDCNLYAWHEGKVSFVASLAGKNRISFGNEPPGDEEDWSAGEPSSVAADRAAITPDGVLLAFVSKESLAGYDNEQAAPGDCESQGCREIYLYDAGTGSLVCASCNPSGARPVGDATLPTGYVGSDYRPRDLSEDGALFFDSSDALVTHASDGRKNVYEYENGHVYPISNVAGRYESVFLDASADGRDVFFATSDQLLPEDTGNNVLVWDARSGGGFPVTVRVPTCTNGDSCKPPVSLQPAYPSREVGTAAIFGQDNVVPPPALPKHRTAAQTRAEKLAKALKACRRKHNKHKRHVCEKAAHRASGAKATATKSTHHKGSK